MATEAPPTFPHFLALLLHQVVDIFPRQSYGMSVEVSSDRASLGTTLFSLKKNFGES